MARDYVAVLAGNPDAPITAQTIAEAPGARGYPVIMHGTVDALWPRMCDLQGEGHGCFLMMNEGDGRGRKAENVVALRALFADQDDPDAGVPEFGAVPPSAVVMSGRGAHYVWALVPGEPLEAFQPAQRGIAAKLGTDRAVSDPARVLRLPGSYNVKTGEPRLVELVHADPSVRYTIAEVLEGLGAEPVHSARRVLAPAPEGPCALGSSGRFRAERYVAGIRAVSGQGGDVQTFKVASRLLTEFGLSRSTAWDVFVEWNATNALPPWSEAELAAKFRNAERYAR